MSEGYIKLFRDIQNWGWYTDNNAKALFLHCLLRANWKPALFLGRRIESGEFVTSLNKLAGETGMTVSQVRTALDKLKLTGELTEFKLQNYRIICITNYRMYAEDGFVCGKSSPYSASVYDAGAGVEVERKAGGADGLTSVYAGGVVHAKTAGFTTETADCVADSFAALPDSESQANRRTIATIEEGKTERNNLSVSSTNVSDTDCQPRLAAGADEAVFESFPDGVDEMDEMDERGERAVTAGAGDAVWTTGAAMADASALAVEPGFALASDPDLEAIENGRPLAGIPAKSRERERVREIRMVIDAWNTLEAVGIKGITSISPDSKRFHALHARLTQHGVDKVLAAIEMVRRSDFLHGVNKRGWVITFDWFVRPNNFNKVLDGNYANRTGNAVASDLDTSWLEY